MVCVVAVLSYRDVSMQSFVGEFNYLGSLHHYGDRKAPGQWEPQVGTATARQPSLPPSRPPAAKPGWRTALTLLPSVSPALPACLCVCLVQNPSVPQIRQLLTEYCILPLGDAQVKAKLQPEHMVKSVMLYGPSGAGEAGRQPAHTDRRP